MPEIHADMKINEVLEIKPHAKDLFFRYGIFSENSKVQSMETLREACEAHGLDDNKIDELVEKLIEI